MAAWFALADSQISRTVVARNPRSENSDPAESISCWRVSSIFSATCVDDKTDVSNIHLIISYVCLKSQASVFGETNIIIRGWGLGMRRYELSRQHRHQLRTGGQNLAIRSS